MNTDSPEPRGAVGTRDDQGAIAAFLALVMVGLLALLGLVIDGGTALTSSQAAQVEAEQAAGAGAGALSVDALRAGVVQIDGAAATAAAQKFMVAAGHPGTVDVVGGLVSVHIRYQVPTAVLGLVGINRITVVADAAAVDVSGVVRGTP